MSSCSCWRFIHRSPISLFCRPIHLHLTARHFSGAAFPIIDSDRSIGLELFCAWQDVFLMTLFFFLSGLFIWPSLKRKGVARFYWRPHATTGTALCAGRRAVDAGRAVSDLSADRSRTRHRRLYSALSGTAVLAKRPDVVLVAAARAPISCRRALHRGPAIGGNRLARLSSVAGTRPVRYLAGLVGSVGNRLCPAGARLRTPKRGAEVGPFSFQLSRPLHYALYFFAGAGLGAFGIERGLLGPEGALTTIGKYGSGWRSARSRCGSA